MGAFTEGKTVLAEVVMVAVVTVRGSSWGFTWRSLQAERYCRKESCCIMDWGSLAR